MNRKLSNRSFNTAHRHGRVTWALALVVVATAGLLVAISPTQAGSDPGSDKAIEPAISRPREESKLTFAAPGLVTQVLVHEGDVVHKGQVLSQQDDRLEQVTLRSDQMDAESTAEVDYEAADVTMKQAQYKRKKEAHEMEGGVVSLPEVEEAQMAVALAQAQVLVAQLHRDQKGMDYQKQKLKVELMQLRSPIDGIVLKINTHAGEMADPQTRDGAIVVVQNDPIWVEMHPSSDRAAKLQMGQELQVRYTAPAGEQANPWMTAKIIYFAPEADAGSKTELVRLELANTIGLRSGLSMEVRLPADVAAIAGGGPSGPPMLSSPQSSAGSNAPASLPPLPN